MIGGARLRVVLVLLATVAGALALPALPARAVPTPEPNFAGTVLPPRPCGAPAGNQYESAQYASEGWGGAERVRYPGACQRLRFTFGPIHIRPGQNDVLLSPVTIEKPAYDGYLVRFAPDLVDAQGNVPPIEQVHLHHAVWTSVTGSYGNGPFAAAGEEKTAFDFPRGFGMPVRGDDSWQLLYMVHSAIPEPTEVFITYDLDYVAKATAESIGIKPAYPIWLDVGPATERSAYPVFNVQRGYGTDGACSWPRQQCAAFDPFGHTRVGQGEAGNGEGVDWRFPRAGGAIGRLTDFTGGTLIWIGGHLHPGGLHNDIDLVRGPRSRRIYTGVAAYWDHRDHARLGGPATSWDYSMRVLSAPKWGVRVRPGDILRSNATYDSTVQSTYEDMGISVAILAPDVDGRPTAPGVDAFAAPTDHRADCPSGGITKGVLCDVGSVTHGHLREADNYGSAQPSTLGGEPGSPTTRVDIAAFRYAPGDLSMISMTGIPTVGLGQTLTFSNDDTFAGDVLHTVTSCAFPCTGAVGIAFPLADGRSSRGTLLDFDSSELGYGLPLGAAKNAVTWDLPITPENGFRRGAAYTYYCRIHPFMRGAFEVS